MGEISELEQEAAASRARLRDTIERIQDKLTVSGMVDDLIGQTGAPRLVLGQDFLLHLLRRHPLPVMIAAAGIGFLAHRASRKARRRHEGHVGEIEVEAVNAGRSRVYDPDAPTRHPLADGADPKRIEA